MPWGGSRARGGSRAPQELTTGLQRCRSMVQQRPPAAAAAAGQPPAPAAAASEATLQQLARQAREAQGSHRTLAAVQARLQVRLPLLLWAISCPAKNEERKKIEQKRKETKFVSSAPGTAQCVVSGALLEAFCQNGEKGWSQSLM